MKVESERGCVFSGELQPWPTGQTILFCASAAGVYAGADKGTALSVVVCVASNIKCCVSVCNVSLWNTSSALLLADPVNLNNSSCIDQTGIERPHRCKCATGLSVAAEKEEWVLDHAGVSNSHNIINRHRLPQKCDHKVLKLWGQLQKQVSDTDKIIVWLISFKTDYFDDYCYPFCNFPLSFTAWYEAELACLTIKSVLAMA